MNYFLKVKEKKQKIPIWPTSIEIFSYGLEKNYCIRETENVLIKAV